MIITGLVTVAVFLLCAGVVAAIYSKQKITVAEDQASITVNKYGFIKRVLPAGRHVLQPFERVGFTLETKTSLTSNRATNIATADGIPVKVNWSAIYALQPQLITESRSQRLKGLLKAENSLARNVDIQLRKLIGAHPVGNLFNPATREQFEQQLNRQLARRLAPLGIVLNSINLQTIELPPEVSLALNQAKAIEMLDSALRRIDPSTREVIRGVYQLDQVLHWDMYLPVPSRQTMKRLKATQP